MKKKIILLIIALISYCWLFYKQSIGINLLIFSVVLILALLIIDHTLLKSKIWLIITLGTLISGVSALLYGSLLSAIGNVISLLLLAHLSMDRNASLLFSLVNAAWNYISMLYYFIEAIFVAKAPDPIAEVQSESKFSMANILKVCIPVAVVFIFFLIYKGSNPIFSAFVNKINLDFFSWDLFCFALFGFILLFGFFFHRKFLKLIDFDQNTGNTIEGFKENEKGLFSDLGKEFSAATLTFYLLNTLLLLVIVLDLIFIFGGHESAAMDHSKYVHQGINSSIFSIIIAISVTLYFFRGNLNFIPKSKTVKVLALIWILLNALLLVTCIHKNFSYIHESGLTHKRIGVYVYILLTFIGLLSTAYKISDLKSNWFLLRVNMWSIYFVLTLSALINWNKLIINYNSKYKSSIEREYYLYQIGNASLPLLIQKWDKMPSSNRFYNQSNAADFERILDLSILTFKCNYEQSSWQSWNLENQHIYQLIKNKPLFKTGN